MSLWSRRRGGGRAIVKPTKLTNVYAVLKGTDPAQAGRRVLVTGHYDSRNSDNFNTHDPAPGANDDASGVAVSLESARVLEQAEVSGDDRVCGGGGGGAGAEREPAPGASWRRRRAGTWRRC